MKRLGVELSGAGVRDGGLADGKHRRHARVGRMEQRLVCVQRGEGLQAAGEDGLRRQYG